MSVRQACACLVSVAICMVFSGCAHYKPGNYIPKSSLKKQYLDDVTSPTLLKVYNAMPAPSPSPDTADAAAQRQAKVDRRNQILMELIALIDNNYSTFEDRYYGSDASVNFAGDVANLGLTGVSSVTGTAHLKSVLSGIATGTTGIKTSYLKNFFDQQTRSAVVQKMRADRATQLALMQDQDHMKAPVVCPAAGCPNGVSPYSIEAGLADVEKYYQAGTIIGALQDIAATAGVDQKAAAEQQKNNSAAPQLF